MHTLVRVKNAYTVMTICLIALGAALLFTPRLIQSSTVMAGASSVPSMNFPKIGRASCRERV